MRIRCANALALAITCCAPALTAAQAPLPTGWPASFELGLMDNPGGAAALRQSATFGFRYNYLSGGANTGSGWSTWYPGTGGYATTYAQESLANHLIPVLSYYNIKDCLRTPAAPPGETESDRVFNNLQNTTTMQAYFADVKLVMQRLGGFPGQIVVLHVEPDFWGYMESRATGNAPSTVPAKVAATGMTELAGLPNDVTGVARAFAHLRDLYAPGVVLGYHVSIWGTGDDIVAQDSNDAQVDLDAAKAAAFFTALGAPFDIAFGETSDRDAYVKQTTYGRGVQGWFSAADYRRHARFFAGFSAGAQKRVVLWQIPLGNTRMRACDDSAHHYQSNEVEWLLDDPGRAHLDAYVQAGVVGLLFGPGGGGSSAFDQAADGVTNPAPLAANAFGGNASPNATASAPAAAGSAPSYDSGTDVLTTPYAADDDGGFFRWKARQYYTAGAAAIPAVTSGAAGSGSSTGSARSCGVGGLAGLLAAIMVGAVGLKRRERNRPR